MRRIVMFGVLGVLALGATGCGALGGSADQPSATPPAAGGPSTAGDPSGASSLVASDSPSATDGPTDGASSAVPSSAAATPADPSQPAAGADQLGTPAATRTSNLDGKSVVLTLYPIIRDGAVSHLNFTLSATEAGERVQIAQQLSDGTSNSGDTNPFTADGIQLVDGKHSKLYLVASDGDGLCLCSRSLASVFAVKEAPALLSATFAAPPADVSTVDVRVPGFGTVQSVPVS